MKILELKMKVSFERSKTYYVTDEAKVSQFIEISSELKAKAIKVLTKEFGNEIINSLNIIYEFEEKT